MPRIDFLGSSTILATYATLNTRRFGGGWYGEEATIAKIRGLGKDVLSEAPASPGITRHLAFRGEDFVVVRSRVKPGVVSGWHHHGDYDLYGYIVSGSLRVEYGSGGRDATSVGPGDFVHIPAHTVHRDVTPSGSEGQEVILFLRGSGSMVVNVEGPDPA